MLTRNIYRYTLNNYNQFIYSSTSSNYCKSIVNNSSNYRCFITTSSASSLSRCLNSNQYIRFNRLATEKNITKNSRSMSTSTTNTTPTENIDSSNNNNENVEKDQYQNFNDEFSNFDHSSLNDNIENNNSNSIVDSSSNSIFSGRSNRETIEPKKREEKFHATPSGTPRAPVPKNNEKDKSGHELRMAHFAKIQEFFNENKHLVDIDGMEHLKKTPVALLFAYIGTGYHGLEYQISGFNALENTLEQALFKAGMILPSNLGDLTRIRWSRSSRTDKGVHSLSTLLGGCLELENGGAYYPENVRQYVDRINKYLPAGLKIIGMAPTARSFDPRRQCVSRIYHYVLPKKCLGTKLTLDQINNDILPLFLGSNSYHNFTHHRRTYKDLDNNNNNNKKQNRHKRGRRNQDEDEEDEENEEENEEEMEEQEEVTNKTETDENGNIIRIVKEWKEIKFDRESEMKAYRVNPKNVRRITSFKVVETPFKTSGDEEEQWVRFEIEGASFIQYQIRKMIGFILAIGNGYCDRRMLELALKSPFSLRSPVAPPNPLYLFDFSLKERTSPAPMMLFEQDKIQPLKEEFCQNQLYPHLAEMNEKDHFYNKFMQELLPSHFYGVHDEQELEKLYSMYQTFLVEQSERKKRQQEFREQKNSNKQNNERSRSPSPLKDDNIYKKQKQDTTTTTTTTTTVDDNDDMKVEKS